MTTLNHDTELEEILDRLAVTASAATDDAVMDDAMHEAKAALNTYLYKQTLGLIGPDKQVTGHARPQGYLNVDLTESYNNQFRAQLRKAAAERWGIQE